MTGRELIIFIMEHKLEDVSMFDEKIIPGLMTLDEAAVKWDSGIHTLKALFEMGKLPGVRIDGCIYIYHKTKNPFEKGENHDK